MEKFFAFFIKNSFLVNLATAFLIITGGISLFSMNRNLVPQWEIKKIRISATLIGASPEQMEELITFPMEEAVSSFSGIEEIESTSTNSQTTIEIKVWDDYQEINDLYEKVDIAINNIIQYLPQDTEQISVVNEKMTYFWFSTVNLLGYNPDSAEHRFWLKNTIDRIKKVSGIVYIRDNSPKPNIYLKLNRENLSRYDITLNDIRQKVGEKFQVLPLGVIDRSSKDVSVEINNNLLDIKSINNLIIKSNASGTYIRLKDIAEVSFRNPKRTRMTYTNGERSERLVLFKDLDTDSLTVKNAIQKLFVSINKNAPTGVGLRVTGDGPAYIERQLNVLKNNGIFGIIFVVLALFLFLGIRSSLMTALGLPLAYFTTFSVLSMVGIGIDLISVVGMILIIGIIVDDAIIVSEQYSQFLEQGHPPKSAALLSIKKTIGPVTGTILTTIVAFLPILSSNDALSTRLRAIPWIVIAALGMSWLECFLILPNHLSHFVKTPTSPKTNLFAHLKKAYRRVLEEILSFRYLLVVFMLIFMVFGVWFAVNNIPLRYQLRIGSERIRVLAVLKESTNLEETEKKLKPLFEMIKKIDSSRYSYINQNLGRAYINGTRFEGHKYTSMAIRFSQTHPTIKEDKAYIQEFLKRELPRIDRTDFELLEVDTRIDGHDEAKDRLINLKIEGKNDVSLDNLLVSTRKYYKDVVGFEKVFINPQLSVEKWDFEFYRESLAKYNLSFRDVALQLRGYVTEDKVYEFRHRGDNIKVYSYFEDNENLTYDQLQNIPINIGQGHVISLRELGRWKKTETLSKINHFDLKRIVNIEVSFNEQLTKKETFTRHLQERLHLFKRDYPALNFVVEDADKEAVKNKQSVGKTIVVAFLLILFVLAVVLGSIVQPFLIATAIPFGLLGVIWAFYFHGRPIDVMAFIGIIGMAGVVVNNSLIMVTVINSLGFPYGDNTRKFIIEGASSRLRPIILTSMTTLGGVFPMAYGLGGDSGFTRPLALALGWGILCATGLTLFLIPCMMEIQKDCLEFINFIIEKAVRGVRKLFKNKSHF